MDTASATIAMKIPGLVALTPGTNYRLVGSYGESGVTSQHRSNHFGSTRLTKTLKASADSVHADSGFVLRFNDMSLSYGGPFDIDNNWNTPHQTHREGTHVDIDEVDSSGKMFPADYLRKELVKLNPRALLKNEGNHYHATVR